MKATVKLNDVIPFEILTYSKHLLKCVVTERNFMSYEEKYRQFNIDIFKELKVVVL